MKITYLYQYFGTPKGSWSTRVYELCKIWVDQGAKVTVITSPYDKSDIQVDKLITKREIDGINLIIINAGDSNRYSIAKRAYKALLFATIATYYAIRVKSETVIASSGPITIGIPGLLSTFFSKKKLVFEVRDLWPSGAIELGLIKSKILKKAFLWFESVCYSKSAFVVPCSEGMEMNIRNRFPKLETLVIPNACDIELFSKIDTDFQFPNWLNQNDKILLYTGSLGLMDACDEIIHGFNLLQNKINVKLVFIGDGTERKQLEELVSSYKLENTVFFLGLIPKTEVVQWYKRALISFVVFKNYPILNTSSPNKMFDSFAAGVPIIQNTKGWISDIVNNFQLGFNVESNNPLSMMMAISDSIENKDLLFRYSLNVKQIAEEKYNRNTLGLTYLKKLNESFT